MLIKCCRYARNFFSKMGFVLLGLIFVTGLAGCAATPSIYHWGKFEDGLHDRFVNETHDQADVYLLETINTAEQQNLRVPPGAYADYGFMLFKRGDREGAIAYFEKEKRTFPESGALMTKLIERIKQNKTEPTEDIKLAPITIKKSE